MWRLTALALLGGVILSGCEPTVEEEDDSLALRFEYFVEDAENLSGLSFEQDHLYTVGDSRGEVYRMSQYGVVNQTVTIDLDVTEQESLEAIAVSGDTVLLAREETGQLLSVSLADGSIGSRFDVPEAEDGNNGLEGVVIHPESGHIYALKEKEPTYFYHLSASGALLSRQTLDFADDLSGLSYLCQDTFLAVSQQERKVYRLSEVGEMLDQWKIDSDRAEGIAFDGVDRVYIVDELENKLQVFGFAGACE